MTRVVLLLVGVLAIARAGLAPFITPCREGDNACMKLSVQKALRVMAPGVPELGLKSLDPLRLERVSESQAGLEMDFRNTIVKGLRNCLVMNAKHRDGKVNIDLKCSVTLVGDYTLGGRLLVLPIQGNGKYGIKIRDIIVKIEFGVGNAQIVNEPHWILTDWKHSADVETNVEFQFQNLFNGNKQLADPIHQFANSNWKDIFQEVAPPIVKAVVAAVVEETKKLFAKIPKKELVLDN